MHPVWPSAKPHLPFAPHTLRVHCEALVQSAPFGDAHVFVVALQSLGVQRAAAFDGVHFPSCSPSFESAVPGACRGPQTAVERLQNWLDVQSASVKHPPFFVHVPDTGAQAPDWQLRAPLATVQPA